MHPNRLDMFVYANYAIRHMHIYTCTCMYHNDAFSTIFLCRGMPKVEATISLSSFSLSLSLSLSFSPTNMKVRSLIWLWLCRDINTLFLRWYSIHVLFTLAINEHLPTTCNPWIQPRENFSYRKGKEAGKKEEERERDIMIETKSRLVSIASYH